MQLIKNNKEESEIRKKTSLKILLFPVQFLIINLVIFLALRLPIVLKGGELINLFVPFSIGGGNIEQTTYVKEHWAVPSKNADVVGWIIHFLVTMKNLLLFDFGNFAPNQKNVAPIILNSLFNTLLLLIPALLLTFLLTFCFYYFVTFKETEGDFKNKVFLIGLIFSALPIFPSFLTLYLFSYVFSIFPKGGIQSERCISGSCTLLDQILDLMVHLLQPLAWLTVFTTAFTILVLWSSSSGYAQLLKEKNLLTKSLYFKAFLLDFLKRFPLIITGLIVSQVFVELVFSWSGIGGLFMSLAFWVNFFMVQGLLYTLTLVLLLTYLITEISYIYLKHTFNQTFSRIEATSNV